jgi:hypothetical protein
MDNKNQSKQIIETLIKLREEQLRLKTEIYKRDQLIKKLMNKLKKK